MHSFIRSSILSKDSKLSRRNISKTNINQSQESRSRAPCSISQFKQLTISNIKSIHGSQSSSALNSSVFNLPNTGQNTRKTSIWQMAGGANNLKSPKSSVSGNPLKSYNFDNTANDNGSDGYDRNGLNNGYDHENVNQWQNHRRMDSSEFDRNSKNSQIQQSETLSKLNMQFAIAKASEVANKNSEIPLEINTVMATQQQLNPNQQQQNHEQLQPKPEPESNELPLNSPSVSMNSIFAHFQTVLNWAKSIGSNVKIEQNSNNSNLKQQQPSHNLPRQSNHNRQSSITIQQKPHQPTQRRLSRSKSRSIERVNHFLGEQQQRSQISQKSYRSKNKQSVFKNLRQKQRKSSLQYPNQNYYQFNRKNQDPLRRQATEQIDINEQDLKIRHKQQQKQLQQLQMYKNNRHPPQPQTRSQNMQQSFSNRNATGKKSTHNSQLHQRQFNDNDLNKNKKQYQLSSVKHNNMERQNDLSSNNFVRSPNSKHSYAAIVQLTKVSNTPTLTKLSHKDSYNQEVCIKRGSNQAPYMNSNNNNAVNNLDNNNGSFKSNNNANQFKPKKLSLSGQRWMNNNQSQMMLPQNAARLSQNGNDPNPSIVLKPNNYQQHKKSYKQPKSPTSPTSHKRLSALSKQSTTSTSVLKQRNQTAKRVSYKADSELTETQYIDEDSKEDDDHNQQNNYRNNLNSSSSLTNADKKKNKKQNNLKQIEQALASQKQFSQQHKSNAQSMSQRKKKTKKSYFQSQISQKQNQQKGNDDDIKLNLQLEKFNNKKSKRNSSKKKKYEKAISQPPNSPFLPQRMHSPTFSKKPSFLLQKPELLSQQRSPNSNKSMASSTVSQSNSSRYQQYISQQSIQLQSQFKRMRKLTTEANKLLYSEGGDHDDSESSSSESQSNPELIQFKYIINELIELFAIAQVIKYQLKYRSFEILTKMFAQASQFYEEQVQVMDPLSLKVFKIVLKAVLPQCKNSQLQIIIEKFFTEEYQMEQNNNGTKGGANGDFSSDCKQIKFDKFLSKFQSCLNDRQVRQLQISAKSSSSSSHNHMDHTLDKVKKLFLAWIEAQYYQDLLRTLAQKHRNLTQIFFLECSDQYCSESFSIQLLEKFFNYNSVRATAVQRIKVDRYFRQILGNALKKQNWSKWVQKKVINAYLQKKTYG